MPPKYLSPFSGTGVALITPFHVNGDVDYEALANIIEYVIQGGVDYVVSLGTTGEAITLSKEECRDVLSFTIAQVSGRLPVVAGHFGRNYTARLVEEVKTYDFTGVAAIMSSSPSYSKPSQAGILEHYRRLADVSACPVLLYNVPGRTASNMQAETVLQLAEESPIFCGVKEASGDLPQAMQILKYRPDGFAVICGDDPLSLGMIAAGGDGTISVMANVFPQQFSDMIRAAQSGNYALARTINFELLEVHPWLYVEGNPVGIKTAMTWAGLCEENFRVPLVPMSRANRSKLLVELAKVKASVSTNL